MPAGRPTKYNTTVIDQVDSYLLATDPTKIPSREGFADYINVNTDTLVEWEKIHKEFSVAIKKVEERQKERLMNDGLYGKANASMAIFLLKANHNMIETSRQELTGKEGSDLQIVLDMPK